MKTKKIIYIGGILFVLILLSAGFVLFRSSIKSPTQSTGFFGFGGAVSTTNTSGGSTNNTQTGSTSLQKVFEIAQGPVASATFIQTYNPTTTVARYVMADSGHVLDLDIDVPGAVARPASNTTIPGITSGVWGANGSSTVLQYVESGTIKSVYIEFASTTQATTITPTRIQFLPNNIMSLAVSPDGSKLTYLLKTSSGSDGYIANIDGTNPTKLFSLPLSETLVSWPATTTLFAQTKSAVGVPGVAFSINTKTGTVTPLLYTSGLTATANSVFSKVIYQTSSGGSTAATTYSHDIATGKDAPLANNPIPEKCAWSPTSFTDLYCALPLDATPANYLDLWHQGLVQTSDSIVQFDTNTGIGTVITLPGDGGATATIDHLAVSADGKYLLFITRGDQSLWGVRLTQ